jgi:hypothetical protein
VGRRRAICTLRFTSHFTDADPAVTFSLVGYCQQHSDCLLDELDDNWRVTQRLGALLGGACDANVLDVATACDADTSRTIIGNNRTISPTCFADVEDTLETRLKPGDVLPRDFGPDSSRHLDCDATESIAPASALDVASVTPGTYVSYLYVPAAGQLALTSASIAARAARRKSAQSAIGTIRITVRHAGPVAVRFRPSQAAKRVLARRHRLTLRVAVTLTIPGHAAIHRVDAITSTQPPKGPSAQHRRQQARRLCLRKHPHATRACKRL